jgi:hypothetical protein
MLLLALLRQEFLQPELRLLQLALLPSSLQLLLQRLAQLAFWEY